jgi:hypothetical protein
MGRTLKTSMRDGDGTVPGTALLETDEIIFRGERRRVIPFASIKSLVVRGGDLIIKLGGEELAFALGHDEATRWLDKIKNPKSVVQKLGLKPAQRICLIGSDDAFAADLHAAGLTPSPKLHTNSDVIFFAVAARTDLSRLPTLKKSLAPDGSLWILRPRGAKDPSESDVRSAALSAGLVDVKVVRVSPEKTGDKFVIPLATRPKPRE